MASPSIVVVGAGAAGIAMGARLKRAGIDNFTIVERSPSIGGTWHDNRYPGAACDVPSHLYCFSFAPNPDWQHRFARQPEIERYLASCVESQQLAPHLRLGTEVAGAHFDEAAGDWRLRTSAGDELRADVLVSGTGQLNRPRIPALPGLDGFAGARFHSARWDPTIDLANKRVAVIGTGASAIQIVPEIAKVARHVTVLQRSPSYVLARNDRPYRAWERWIFRNVPFARSLYRSLIYWSLEARFTALHRDSLMSQLVRWMALRHLRSQIADPMLRAKLTPTDPIGCKRILISDDWYQTLASDRVSVVTAPIERITESAVVTSEGTHPADVLIFATGFDTTCFLAPMQIVGRDGASLADTWRAGASAHHGIVVPGFPNLFLLYGPNTNLGHNSILFMIECQVRYVVRCLDELARRGARWLDVRREAATRSDASIQAALAKTAWVADCHSWYKTDAGRVTNNWSGRTFEYWRRTRRPNFADFEISTDPARQLSASGANE